MWHRKTTKSTTWNIETCNLPIVLHSHKNPLGKVWYTKLKQLLNIFDKVLILSDVHKQLCTSKSHRHAKH